jgi:hypothetical protein
VTAPAWLRLTAAAGTLLIAGAAVVVAIDLLKSTPGPVGTAIPSVPAASAPAATTTTTHTATNPLSAGVQPIPRGFPAPPPGAVVFAREDGFDTLALGVVPEKGGVTAQVSVLTDQGRGRPGLAIKLTVQGHVKKAVPCGLGCYRARFATSGNPGAVTVDVKGYAATTHWRVALPAVWPAPDASKLMAKATSTWLGLQTLSYIDRLASGPGERVVSQWEIVAPDRVAYQFPDGSASVIVGQERWDLEAGSKTWQRSAQEPPLQQPVPFWTGYTNAHVLGSGTFAGRPVWQISFFDPGSLAWFRIALDKSTGHTLDLHMDTTAHFMHDTYSNFDKDIKIEPPGSADG